MVLTSLRAYNLKLCPEQKAVNICFIYRMKKKKFESIFHFDRLFTKLIIINANGAGSLRLSRNYRAKTLTLASM